jgi:hypothetical protein
VVELIDKLAVGLGGVTVDDPPLLALPPPPPPHPAMNKAAAMQLKNRVIRDIVQAIPTVFLRLCLHNSTLLSIFKYRDGGTGKEVAMDEPGAN